MSDTAEDTTEVLAIQINSSGDPVDLSNATLEFVRTTGEGTGTAVVSKTDADATVYTAASDINSELATILQEDEGLTASEATDRSNGRFVVEITPDEMPGRGYYWDEVRATWPSGRSFADVLGQVRVTPAQSE